MLITSSNPNLCETLDITNLVDYSYQLTDTEGIAYKFKANKLANLVISSFRLN